VYSYASLLAAPSSASLLAGTESWAQPMPKASAETAKSAGHMVEAILEKASCHLGEFDAQGLTNLAQALAKLELRRKKLLGSIAQHAGPKISNFTNQELAMLAWSQARLGCLWGRALRVVTEEARARLEALTAQDLSVLVWAFARSGRCPDSSDEAAEEEADHKDPGNRQSAARVESLSALSGAVLRCARRLTPQDLSTVVWGYAFAAVECPSMMDAVAEECVQKIVHFSPQDMANSAWGLAKLSFLHEGFMEALAEQITRRARDCQGQHLSIIAWSFAKLGLACEAPLAALAAELATKASELDAQGVGNSIWAFGVLSFWSAGFVEAVGRRAVAVVEQLTAQEMANAAFGLQVLSRWRQQEQGHADIPMCSRLQDFLRAASAPFCRKAGLRDGASWTDFANVARAEHAAFANVGDASLDTLKEVDTRFRCLMLEPAISCLLRILPASQEHAKDSPRVALSDLQLILDDAASGSGSGGLPNLGEHYTREALQRMGLAPAATADSQGNSNVRPAPAAWVEQARRECRSSAGERWRIPSTDTVLAFVAWDVSSSASSSSGRWRNAGRVYRSADAPLGRQGGRGAEELLRPLRQHIRRDAHPERLALLELFEEIGGRQEEMRGALAGCRGWVQVYVTQYPCLSCLAVFCQFCRRCPQTQLEVDFDNAWTSLCGKPRYLAR
ncbi:unnamed protein product, partial [Polarella glacialis]